MPLPLVFTRATAVAAGREPRRIDDEVRRGRWTALRRGVYAVTAALPDDAAGRHAAAVTAAALATTSDVVGSHESAALVHGLPLFEVYEGPPVLSRCRDFCSAQHRTVGEAGGLLEYRAGTDGRPEFAVLRAEKVREDALRDAGFEVFRFTWEEAVHRPQLLEQRARRAFARAALRRTS